MHCPRCKTSIGPLSHPDSIVTCPGCGSRLMTRSAVLRSQGGPKPPGKEPGSPEPPPPRLEPPPLPPRPAAARPAVSPPSATQPPASAILPGTKPAAPSAPPTGSDTARKRRGDTKASRAEAGATLDLLLQEVRSLRETQGFILAAIEGLRRSLSSGAAADDPAGPGGGDDADLSPIRGGREKKVVLVDDDPRTREAAVAELRQSDVPVRAYADGNAALSAIAQEKPDLIVLELGLGGDMGGKDLVNMIKATMEWVDIPIVLWTREAVSSQREARQIHGADEVVPKSAGPAALVARVITAFRHA